MALDCRRRVMPLAVVLVAPRNPLNIGAAARAISNFGFADLRVVQPYELAFREAVSAVGGAAVLQNARVFGSLADALTDCSLVIGTTSIGNRDLQQPIYTLEASAPLVRGHMVQERVALLFGSEKFGLSNDDLSFCHHLLRIPTVPETPSMNLGQSVAVCLYELIRDPAAVAAPRLRRATSGSDVEQLTTMLLELLELSGYTNRIVAVSTSQKIRRFFRRIRLEQRDARLVLGILRQLLWKLKG
jgi:TrmH family RNA methyltransferase